jgi:hypothetical protein
MKLPFYSKSPMADRRPDGSSYLNAHAAHGVGDINTVGVPRQISQFRLGSAKGRLPQTYHLILPCGARKAVKGARLARRLLKSCRSTCDGASPARQEMSGDGKKSRLRLAPISLVHSAARERDCLRAWCEQYGSDCGKHAATRQGEKRNVVVGPEHDWSSNAADAFG